MAEPAEIRHALRVLLLGELLRDGPAADPVQVGV
jgi:hypothetical protein